MKDLSLATELYKERTRAMTGFKLSEIGNDSKTSFADFLHVLDGLIADFQSGSYDDRRTLIPVDKKGEPIDGAHRISCAAYFNKKVRVLRFLDREVPPYDYAYLAHDLLPSSWSDLMALEALEWHDDIYAFFLWPKAHRDKDKLQEALSLISSQMDVLYEVDYKLTFEAIRNLMIQLYGHMDWVGSIDDGFANITGKADEVWDKNGTVRIVLVRAPGSDEVLALKKQVRDLFGIGLASIHSTDNIRETKLAMNALLNPNSRHHLLHADVTRYKDTYRLFKRFKEMVEKGGFDKREFVLDTGMVMGIYGLRPTNDLDYCCLHKSQDKTYPEDEDIEEHDEAWLQFCPVPMKDLVCNPRNYFVFDEMKFVTLREQLLYKQSRYKTYHFPKDQEDIRLIQNVLSQNGRFRKHLNRLLLNLKRKKRVYRQTAFANLVKITRLLHVYEPLRSMKRFLKHS